MFLSIIIPVYNAEQYLDECLQSCINQDIDVSDYEIICINDGSKDNSLNILKQYEKNYKNIIVIDKPNSGVSETRNKGIEVAKADYIWFVDSDDFIKPNCLKYLKSVADENYDIINFGAYAFNEVFTDEEKTFFNNNQIKANKTYWGYPSFHLYANWIIQSNKIRFISEIKYGEDEMFYVDMLECSKNICDLEDAIYFYRKNPNSVMSNANNKENKHNYMKSILTSMEILKQGLENGVYSKDFTKEFFLRRYKVCVNSISRLKFTDTIYFLKQMKEMGFLLLVLIVKREYGQKKILKRICIKCG